MTKGPSEEVKRGPILTDITFPNVLVAKAYSHDGVGMDLVLYPGAEAGDFNVGFERLQPGAKYTLGGKDIVASKSGEASVQIRVDGRTQLTLKRQ